MFAVAPGRSSQGRVAPSGAYPWPALRLLALPLAALLLAGCPRPRPGERMVKEVTLRGNRVIPAGEVLGGLETQETGWWALAEVHPYDPVALERDVKRIKTYYATRGFFQARVVRHKVRPRDRQSVEVTFVVQEGEPAAVEGIELEGLEALSAAQRRRAGHGLGLRTGARYDHLAFLAAEKRLQARLRAMGYAYAEVEGTALVRRGKRRVRVTLRAKPGPLVRLRRCVFTGVGEIPLDKLQSLVPWAPGDPYDPAKFKLLQARLISLHVFSSAHIDLPQAPTADAVVTARVELSKLKELRLGAGVGLLQERHQAHVRLDWTWRNFMGGLRTLEVRLKPALVVLPTFWDAEEYGPGMEASVKLTQPDILGSGVSAFVKAGYFMNLDEGYKEHGLKASAGLERPFWGQRLRLGLSWNIHLFDFFDIDEELEKLLQERGKRVFSDPYRTTWLEQYARLDLRDDPRDPRAGFWAQLRLEEGYDYWGSDYAYIKVTPEARGYIPLGTKRVVLALRAYFGYLHPLRQDDSPISRRYELGGPTSHRGFGALRLSALERYANTTTGVVESFPLGGDAALLFSADLRVRVYKLLGSWLSLVPYADGGDSVHGIDELDLARLHWAVGGAIGYDTPIGALLITLGFRLNRLLRQEEDGRWNPDPNKRIVFHLIFGGSF